MEMSSPYSASSPSSSAFGSSTVKSSFSFPAFGASTVESSFSFPAFGASMEMSSPYSASSSAAALSIPMRAIFLPLARLAPDASSSIAARRAHFDRTGAEAPSLASRAPAPPPSFFAHPASVFFSPVVVVLNFSSERLATETRRLSITRDSGCRHRRSGAAERSASSFFHPGVPSSRKSRYLRVTKSKTRAGSSAHASRGTSSTKESQRTAGIATGNASATSTGTHSAATAFATAAAATESSIPRDVTTTQYFARENAPASSEVITFSDGRGSDARTRRSPNVLADSANVVAHQ